MKHLICIAGLPQHGKTTLASILAHYTGLRWSDTSAAIYMSLAAQDGTSVAALKQQDKNTLRPRLIEHGDTMCEKDPAYLCETLIDSGVSIISGVRKIREWEVIRQRHPEAILVWVQTQTPTAAAAIERMVGAGYKIHSAEETYDSTEVALMAKASAIINNITIEQLGLEAARFITTL